MPGNNLKLEIENVEHRSKGKTSMTRDEAGSHRTLKKVVTDEDGDEDSKSFVKPKGRMSKRDSAYFKPTEKDNKVLGELIMKGLPQKERYKINIIPCNSGNMSRRNIPKSKSAEDIDELIKEEQKREEELGDDKVFEKSKADRLLENLTMIASRARSVERKAKRPRSRRVLTRFHRHQNRSRLLRVREDWKILGILPNSLPNRRRWVWAGLQSATQKKRSHPSHEKYNPTYLVISKSKIDKKNQGKMFFEFQILKNIDHPHIIRIYEVYNDAKNLYLITEYCEGGDIFSMIQKADNFNEKIASRIMKQVINAILYCHLNGIVHRDIKADNILFLNNNINSPIKLIDFGISVKFEKDTKLKEKTGTVLYIAPEVIDGNYDEKCDIWASGVLMYMMLSGLPPFYGSNRKEVMAKIKKGKFSFKSKIWSLITQEAKDLIELMLTYDPEKRPSCREVLNHPWFMKEEQIKINTAMYLENMNKYEVGLAG